MKWHNRALALAAVAILTVVGAKTATAGTSTHPPTRSCPEDATWVGMGDYRGGYYTWYKCMAMDDVTAWYKRR